MLALFYFRTHIASIFNNSLCIHVNQKLEERAKRNITNNITTEHTLNHLLIAFVFYKSSIYKNNAPGKNEVWTSLPTEVQCIWNGVLTDCLSGKSSVNTATVHFGPFCVSRFSTPKVPNGCTCSEDYPWRFHDKEQTAAYACVTLTHFFYIYKQVIRPKLLTNSSKILRPVAAIRRSWTIYSPGTWHLGLSYHSVPKSAVPNVVSHSV